VTATGRILGFAGGALVALLATLLLGAAVGGGEFVGWLGAVLGSAASGVTGRASVAVVGILLLAGDVTLLLRMLGLGASKVIDFESESGEMTVDVSALEECLRRTAVDDHDVADAVASLRLPRGGLEKPIICNVQVALHERADVVGKGKELAAAVRRRFLQIIPIETDPVVNINIRIRPPKPGAEAAKVTQAMVAHGPPAIEAEEDAPLPDVPDFTGERRYGDDDEEEDQDNDDKSGES
jgi:hypothetical protein